MKAVATVALDQPDLNPDGTGIVRVGKGPRKKMHIQRARKGRFYMRIVIHDWLTYLEGLLHT